MLANLAGDAWKWGVFNERLQGVPWPSNPFAEWFLYRADLFAELDLPLPTTADEFLAVGEEINDPDGNRWAFGDFYRVMRQVFGAPREWRYAEGRLVHQVETPEFAASVEFLRRVYDAGLVHPDIAAGGTNNKELLNSGRILVDQDAVSAITEAYQAVLADDPGFRLALLPVFGHDGGAPDMHRNSPSEHCVFLRKDLAEDAQRELLTVLDYCAAPFGTEEYMNYRYGTEGEHYEFRDGAPQLTELGQQEVGNGYLFLSGRPSPIVESQYPDYVEPRAAWFNDAIRYSGEDPFQGIRIQRPDAYASVETPTTDKVMDIIRGRREVRELEDVVGEWRRDGGDEGRAFFEQVLQDHGRD
jgi:putative aldouronate transport system substrate-binding protein